VHATTADISTAGSTDTVTATAAAINATAAAAVVAAAPTTGVTGPSTDSWAEFSSNTKSVQQCDAFFVRPYRVDVAKPFGGGRWLEPFRETAGGRTEDRAKACELSASSVKMCQVGSKHPQ
jgi:hypothetical protein